MESSAKSIELTYFPRRSPLTAPPKGLLGALEPSVFHLFMLAHACPCLPALPCISRSKPGPNLDKSPSPYAMYAHAYQNKSNNQTEHKNARFNFLGGLKLDLYPLGDRSPLHTHGLACYIPR